MNAKLCLFFLVIISLHIFINPCIVFNESYIQMRSCNVPFYYLNVVLYWLLCLRVHMMSSGVCIISVLMYIIVPDSYHYIIIHRSN